MLGFQLTAGQHYLLQQLSNLLIQQSAEQSGLSLPRADVAEGLYDYAQQELLQAFDNTYGFRFPLFRRWLAFHHPFRQVRDYRMQSSGQEVITGGSAFNIKATSLRLGNFSADEVHTLWQQHTTQTGQVFNKEIFSNCGKIHAVSPGW